MPNLDALSLESIEAVCANLQTFFDRESRNRLGDLKKARPIIADLLNAQMLVLRELKSSSSKVSQAELNKAKAGMLSMFIGLYQGCLLRANVGSVSIGALNVLRRCFSPLQDIVAGRSISIETLLSFLSLLGSEVPEADLAAQKRFYAEIPLTDRKPSSVLCKYQRIARGEVQNERVRKQFLASVNRKICRALEMYLQQKRFMGLAHDDLAKRLLKLFQLLSKNEASPDPGPLLVAGIKALTDRHSQTLKPLLMTVMAYRLGHISRALCDSLLERKQKTSWFTLLRPSAFFFKGNAGRQLLAKLYRNIAMLKQGFKNSFWRSDKGMQAVFLDFPPDKALESILPRLPIDDLEIIVGEKGILKTDKEMRCIRKKVLRSSRAASLQTSLCGEIPLDSDSLRLPAQTVVKLSNGLAHHLGKVTNTHLRQSLRFEEHLLNVASDEVYLASLDEQLILENYEKTFVGLAPFSDLNTAIATQIFEAQSVPNKTDCVAHCQEFRKNFSVNNPWNRQRALWQQLLEATGIADKVRACLLAENPDQVDLQLSSDPSVDLQAFYGAYQEAGLSTFNQLDRVWPQLADKLIEKKHGVCRIAANLIDSEDDSLNVSENIAFKVLLNEAVIDVFNLRHLYDEVRRRVKGEHIEKPISNFMIDNMVHFAREKGIDQHDLILRSLLSELILTVNKKADFGRALQQTFFQNSKELQAIFSQEAVSKAGLSNWKEDVSSRYHAMLSLEESKYKSWFQHNLNQFVANFKRKLTQDLLRYNAKKIRYRLYMALAKHHADSHFRNISTEWDFSYLLRSAQGFFRQHHTKIEISDQATLKAEKKLFLEQQLVAHLHAFSSCITGLESFDVIEKALLFEYVASEMVAHYEKLGNAEFQLKLQAGLSDLAKILKYFSAKHTSTPNWTKYCFEKCIPKLEALMIEELSLLASADLSSDCPNTNRPNFFVALRQPEVPTTKLINLYEITLAEAAHHQRLCEMESARREWFRARGTESRISGIPSASVHISSSLFSASGPPRSRPVSGSSSGSFSSSSTSSSMAERGRTVSF